MSRRRSIVGGAVLIGAALLAYLAFGGGSPERDTAADAGTGEDADADPGLTWLLRGDPDAGSHPSDNPPASADPSGSAAGAEAERPASQWPDKRRAAARRRVEIVPLGPDTPQVEADQVLDSLAAQRPVMQECVREAGGFSTIWKNIHGSERAAGPGGFGLTFDVGPKGEVVPESTQMQPQPMEPFGSCLRRAIDGAQMPPPGSDGARIGLDFRAKQAEPLDAGTGAP